MSATVEPASSPAKLVPARLHPGDLGRVASVGLRTRRTRAALSALGIAIGVAAIVAVLGLSSSSQAGLLEEIDELGTNLLIVTNGQGFAGNTAELPLAAPAMISRIYPVEHVAQTGKVSGAVYRSPLIPSVDTNALDIEAASLNLLHALNIPLTQGSYLNAATATEPVAVLGPAAAQRLGIDHIYPGERIWLDNQWFYPVGILGPSTLTPEIEGAVLVGFPAAKRYLGFNGHPNTVYVRAQNSQVAAVQSVLAATADPEAPNEVDVSLPSATLTARADAQGALQRPVPRTRRGGPAGGRGGGGEHHGHLRAGTPLGDRPAPRARRHERPDPPAVPVRSDPAVARRWRGRHRHGHPRHRHLCEHQALGDRDPHARVGRRVRGCAADRRDRRAAAGDPRRAPLTH